MKGKVIYSTKLSGDITVPTLEKASVLALKTAAVCSAPSVISGIKTGDAFNELQALITELGGSIVEANGNYKLTPITSENGFITLFSDDLAKIDEYINDENFFHDGDIYIKKKVCAESIIAVLIGLVFYSHKSNVMLDFVPDDKEYIDLAVGIINRFGGIIDFSNYNTYNCSSANKLIGGGVVYLERDWNIVAFGIMCGALGHKLNIKEAHGAFSVQKGSQIISPMKRMGFKLEKGIDGTLRAGCGDEIFPTAIDALECPDFLPYMILLAALGNGNTEIYNIGDGLTEEQSERIVNAVAEFAKLGIKFIETGDGSFKVNGLNAFEGGVKLDCCNDYIVATSMIIATLCCKKSNTIINYDVLEEQYPEFWRMFESIGGFGEIIV